MNRITFEFRMLSESMIDAELVLCIDILRFIYTLLVLFVVLGELSSVISYISFFVIMISFLSAFTGISLFSKTERSILDYGPLFQLDSICISH